MKKILIGYLVILTVAVVTLGGFVYRLEAQRDGVTRLLEDHLWFRLNALDAVVSHPVKHPEDCRGKPTYCLDSGKCGCAEGR